MPAKKEIIKIKTATGSVHIQRTANKATVKEERTCFGFKEKSITEITRLSDECIHYAFDDENRIRETYKNH